MNGCAFALLAVSLAACTPLREDIVDSGEGRDSASPDVTVPANGDDAGDASRDAQAEAGPGDAQAEAGPGDAQAEAGPGDARAEASIDAVAPCGPPSLTASDIYVDTNATGPSYGSLGCPLRTISDALQAAARSTAVAKTIHVAAGVYDAAHGEQFPLDLREGVSLVGAGAATTIIQGSGHVLASSYWREFYAAIEVGNRIAPTGIQGVRILPGPATPAGVETEAVFCGAGNVSLPGATPPHNTDLSDLEIGPGFSFDVKLVGAPDACNLRLSRSKLHGGGTFGGGTGVFVAGSGCGGYNTAPNQPYPVALEVGDGTSAGGNTLDGFHGDAAWGIRVQGCISSFIATSNVVEDSDIGLGFETFSSTTEPVPTIRMANNVFRRLAGKEATIAGESVLVGGVFIEAARANVADFSGNTFSEVRAPFGSPPVAALSVAALSQDTSFPDSFHAHGNQFDGNDIGILIQSRNNNVLTGSSVFDFGTNGNGNNEFRCNAHTAASPGGDVVVDANSDGTAAVALSGNAWDHASPTVAATAPADGTDLALLRSPKPTIDTSTARVSTLACPTGFAP